MIRTLVIASLLATGGATSAFAQTSPQAAERGPITPPTFTSRYGAAPRQFGELRIPRGGRGPYPVAITIHGGCFLNMMGSAGGFAPLATALTEQGYATWNIEYRAVGDEGGAYPGTYQDWAAAADHLRELARRYPLDLSRVVVVGHSAGAPAAAFLAARRRMPARSAVRGRNPLPVHAVVAIDGPADLSGLAGRDAAVCGRPVIAELLGGTQAQQPARYREVSPLAHLPLGVPMYFVSASPVLPRDVLEAYQARATAAGDRTTAIYPAGGDHFNIVKVDEPQWRETRRLIDQAFADLNRRR